MARSADLDVLARRTPGFTGADLANLLNEAAILTARRNLRQIGMRECEEAIDRVLAGPERKTLVMSEHDKLVTAYHEAGHALVGHVLPHADPIHKVSIVARSRSLGLTFTLPEDRVNHSRSQLRDAMAMCLGGRSAEEIVFSEPTTGAENDIEKVTQIARAMVTEYGMSERLGPQQLSQPGGEVFLGREFGRQAGTSEKVAATIDAEVRHLIDEAHGRARAALTHHRPTLDRLARQLVEKETLDALELADLLGPLEPWVGDDESGRPSSGRSRRRRGSEASPAEPVAPVSDPAPAAPSDAADPAAAPEPEAGEAKPAPPCAPAPGDGRRPAGSTRPGAPVPAAPRSAPVNRTPTAPDLSLPTLATPEAGAPASPVPAPAPAADGADPMPARPKPTPTAAEETMPARRPRPRPEPLEP
jgi:cell division protease FtsH